MENKSRNIKNILLLIYLKFGCLVFEGSFGKILMFNGERKKSGIPRAYLNHSLLVAGFP